MKRKISFFLVLVMLATMVLSACGSKSGNDTGNNSNTSSNTDTSSTTDTSSNTDSGAAGGEAKQLVAEIGPNPETIDPALNSAVDGGNMILFAFDCLLNVDKDNKIIPGAAESYDVSPDGLTWTFHLRKDLKWSDGSPLTANDFVYSWKRVADPNTAAPYG